MIPINCTHCHPMHGRRLAAEPGAPTRGARRELRPHHVLGPGAAWRSSSRGSSPCAVSQRCMATVARGRSGERSVSEGSGALSNWSSGTAYSSARASSSATPLPSPILAASSSCISSSTRCRLLSASRSEGSLSSACSAIESASPSAQPNGSTVKRSSSCASSSSSTARLSSSELQQMTGCLKPCAMRCARGTSSTDIAPS
mmetsp:Transcript_24877/g.63027  ORF Transcript_24877/g.63027 Transcript_24877/m.63027 type:complete len:201 (-) Transcript_24877:273-875(-)